MANENDPVVAHVESDSEEATNDLPFLVSIWLTPGAAMKSMIRRWEFGERDPYNMLPWALFVGLPILLSYYVIPDTRRGHTGGIPPFIFGALPSLALGFMMYLHVSLVALFVSMSTPKREDRSAFHDTRAALCWAYLPVLVAVALMMFTPQIISGRSSEVPPWLRAPEIAMLTIPVFNIALAFSQEYRFFPEEVRFMAVAKMIVLGTWSAFLTWRYLCAAFGKDWGVLTGVGVAWCIAVFAEFFIFVALGGIGIGLIAGR